MPDESVTVKGSPVRSLQKFIDGNLTPDQREKIFSSLPEAFKRFRSPVLATEVVPVYMLNRLTEEAAKARGESLEEFARRAGREAARDAVKGIYRFFAMVLTTPALLNRASQMWTTLYNRGDLRVDEQTDTSAKLRLVNFPSEPAGCARISGWIEGMAELTGAKQIQVKQTQCFAKGGPCCEWQITWK
jgi:uncharacterized protein (TIGR02265 family)